MAMKGNFPAIDLFETFYENDCFGVFVGHGECKRPNV